MESWAVIVIVAIVATTLGNVYRTTLKHRNESRGGHDTEIESLKARIVEIEARLGTGSVIDRLNALETIVTDSRYELDREINRLTDTPSRT